MLPSTLDKVTLVGEFSDGTIAEGETKITDLRKPLKRISLRPTNCRATEEALEALRNADLIIMGPGSLYTSILPNLLLQDITNAVLESDAYKIFIINAMTQPGETEGYTAYDHLRVLISHTDPGITDACFINTQPIPKAILDRYQETNSRPVDIDLAKIREQGYEVIGTEFLKIDTQVRHDPSKLAKTIIDHYFEVLKR